MADFRRLLFRFPAHRVQKGSFCDSRKINLLPVLGVRDAPNLEAIPNWAEIDMILPIVYSTTLK